MHIIYTTASLRMSNPALIYVNGYSQVKQKNLVNLLNNTKKNKMIANSKELQDFSKLTILANNNYKYMIDIN